MSMTTSATIDLTARVNAGIPKKSGDKSWAKIISHVDQNAKDGNDWSGDWAERGSTIDLPVGAIMVDCDVDYDKKRRRDRDEWYTALRVLFPNGAWHTISISKIPAWGQEMRAMARKLLAMDVAERIKFTAEDYLKDNAEKRKTDIALDQRCELREEWISILTPKKGIPPHGKRKAAMIAKIKVIMTKYGIRIDELS